MKAEAALAERTLATMPEPSPLAGYEGPTRPAGVEKSALRVSEGLLAVLSGRSKARKSEGPAELMPGDADGYRPGRLCGGLPQSSRSSHSRNLQAPERTA